MLLHFVNSKRIQLIVSYCIFHRTLTDGNRALHTHNNRNKIETICRSPCDSVDILRDFFRFFLRLNCGKWCIGSWPCDPFGTYCERRRWKTTKNSNTICFVRFFFPNPFNSVCLSTIANCYCCAVLSNIRLLKRKKSAITLFQINLLDFLSKKKNNWKTKSRRGAIDRSNKSMKVGENPIN